MQHKLNDIKYGGVNVPDTLQLNRAQLSNLSDNQIEGRDAVYIRGIKGYIDGDGMWKSIKFMNKLKSKGKWKQ